MCLLMVVNVLFLPSLVAVYGSLQTLQLLNMVKYFSPYLSPDLVALLDALDPFNLFVSIQQTDHFDKKRVFSYVEQYNVSVKDRQTLGTFLSNGQTAFYGLIILLALSLLARLNSSDRLARVQKVIGRVTLPPLLMCALFQT